MSDPIDSVEAMVDHLNDVAALVRRTAHIMHPNLSEEDRAKLTAQADTNVISATLLAILNECAHIPQIAVRQLSANPLGSQPDVEFAPHVVVTDADRLHFWATFLAVTDDMPVEEQRRTIADRGHDLAIAEAKSFGFM